MTCCPYCEGQGIIHKADIIATGERIYICGECDTMWQSDTIDVNSAQPFEHYMKDKGLKGYWTELTNVEQL